MSVDWLKPLILVILTSLAIGQSYLPKNTSTTSRDRITTSIHPKGPHSIRSASYHYDGIVPFCNASTPQRPKPLSSWALILPLLATIRRPGNHHHTYTPRPNPPRPHPNSTPTSRHYYGYRYYVRQNPWSAFDPLGLAEAEGAVREINPTMPRLDKGNNLVVIGREDLDSFDKDFTENVGEMSKAEAEKFVVDKMFGGTGRAIVAKTKAEVTAELDKLKGDKKKFDTVVNVGHGFGTAGVHVGGEPATIASAEVNALASVAKTNLMLVSCCVADDPKNDMAISKLAKDNDVKVFANERDAFVKVNADGDKMTVRDTTPLDEWNTFEFTSITKDQLKGLKKRSQNLFWESRKKK